MSSLTTTGNALRRRSVTRSMGLGLAALATASLVTAAPSTATAHPAASAPSAVTAACSIGVAGLTASGDRMERVLSATTPVNDVPTDYGSVQPNDFPVAPRALTTVFHDQEPRIDGDYWRFETFFATVQGVLEQHSVNTIYRGTEVISRRVDVRKYSSGWGGFRTLVISDTVGRTNTGTTIMLYGHHDNGSLYRYALTPGTGGYSIRSAGSVAGFGALKGITLISQQTSADVLLANTTAGTLITIRSPHTAAMSTTVTRVRNSSWQGFSRLALDRCGTGSILSGLHAATGKIYVYTLAFVTGTSTPITGWGATTATYPWTTFTQNPDSYTPRLSGA